MAGDSRTTFFATVKADVSEAVAEFNKAGDKINKSMDRASSSVTRLDNAMERLGRGLVGGVAFGQIINLSKQMVQSTAKLEDTIAAAGVTFGDFSGDIEEFAKDASKNFGLSTVAALDAANQFAALGKSAGLTGQDLAGFSKEMVALAGDLSSFRGTTVEEAITAIGSGLRGESEPLRRFGVLLNDATLKARAMAMGIYAGTDALTPQQKVLAAQAEILAQTTDAQGDFARTADSTANSLKTATAEMENAKAAAGEALAPAITALAQSITPVLTGFGNLDPEIQSLITTTGLGVAAFSAASSALQGLGVAAATANAMLGPVVAAMTVATLAYAAHTREKAAQERTTNSLVDVLQQENKVRKENLSLLALSDDNVKTFVQGMKNLGIGTADVSNYVRTGTGRLAGMADAIGDVLDATEGVYPELAALSEEILGQSLAGDTLTEKYQSMTVEQIDAAVSVRDFYGELGLLRNSFLETAATTALVESVTNDAAGATDGMTEATVDLEAAEKDLRERLEGTLDLIKRKNDAYQTQLDLIAELYGKERNAIQRQRDYSDAQQDFKDILGDSNATVDDQIDSAIKLSEEYGTLEGASLDSATGTERQIGALDMLLATVKPGSELYNGILEYKKLLESIPAMVATQVNLGMGVNGRMFAAGVATTGAATLKTMTGDIANSVSAAASSFYGPLGGTYAPPTKSTGDVAPDRRTSVTINIYKPVASGEQIANELSAYIRRNGSTWLSGAR